MKNFNELAGHSKIWIYQTNKPLTDEEVARIKNTTTMFISQWQSHGADMDAACELFLNRFIVVGLDETSAGASGCGIDKLFNHMKRMEAEFQISLYDRLNVYYMNLDAPISFPEIKSDHIKQTHISTINESEIDATSYFFDNTILTKKDIMKAWVRPVNETWLMNYLDKQKV